ncbi:unnamed protein product, partial [Didymodactylos carnosus]
MLRTVETIICLPSRRNLGEHRFSACPIQISRPPGLNRCEEKAGMRKERITFLCGNSVLSWYNMVLSKNRTIQFSYAKLFQRQKPSKRLQNRPSPRQTRHNQNVPQLVMIAELVQDLISRNLADYKNSGLICYDRETIDKQLFEYLKRYYKV